jgi:hypothetical protein
MSTQPSRIQAHKECQIHTSTQSTRAPANINDTCTCLGMQTQTYTSKHVHTHTYRRLTASISKFVGPRSEGYQYESAPVIDGTSHTSTQHKPASTLATLSQASQRVCSPDDSESTLTPDNLWVMRFNDSLKGKSQGKLLGLVGACQLLLARRNLKCNIS